MFLEGIRQAVERRGQNGDEQTTDAILSRRRTGETTKMLCTAAAAALRRPAICGPLALVVHARPESYAEELRSRLREILQALGGCPDVVVPGCLHMYFPMGGPSQEARGRHFFDRTWQEYMNPGPARATEDIWDTRPPEETP